MEQLVDAAGGPVALLEWQQKTMPSATGAWWTCGPLAQSAHGTGINAGFCDLASTPCHSMSHDTGLRAVQLT